MICPMLVGDNMIDITMTATVRPSIIRETICSFKENLLIGNEYKLIINIDPIGEEKDPMDVLNEVYKFFDSSQVVYNIPEQPGFTKAVMWCWEQTNSKYVFHLEDDWRIKRSCDIKKMTWILDHYPTLVSLRLNKEPTHKPKNGYNTGFVLHEKLSLNPTLFRGSFLRDVVKLMDVNKNPEKQLRLHDSNTGKFLRHYEHAIYTEESYSIIVEDIGRRWMKKSDYEKITGFLNWEKKK